ncbi:MAG: hypothetical protein WC223_01625 [Bacteroidales bacterium]|jgi:antitoxin component YwqK of YwqJK toxin-antitoxin module
MIRIHKEFSKEDKLLVEGQYDEQGLKTGIWEEYYKNGKIAAIESYKNGKLHGYYKSFHENGNIWSLGKYNQGCKEGVFEIYDQQGKLILIQHYSQDKLINQITINK